MPVIIEHNLNVIKTADRIVDLGPEGGSGGGQILEQGTPEQDDVPVEEETTGELPQEPTTEEDNYWPPEDGNGSEDIQEESTEQFNYEENTEEYYEENTGEYYDNGTGSADLDRAQNEY